LSAPAPPTVARLSKRARDYSSRMAVVRHVRLDAAPSYAITVGGALRYPNP